MCVVGGGVWLQPPHWLSLHKGPGWDKLNPNLGRWACGQQLGLGGAAGCACVGLALGAGPGEVTSHPPPAKLLHKHIISLLINSHNSPGSWVSLSHFTAGLLSSGPVQIVSDWVGERLRVAPEDSEAGRWERSHRLVEGACQMPKRGAGKGWEVG